MKRIFTLAVALGFVIGVQKVYAQQEGKELLGKWGKILNSRNFEVKFHSYEEFNEKGVPLHFIGENMAETIIAHDEHGPVIELRNGVKTYHVYDSDGNETYRSDSLGHERRAEYDSFGNMTHIIETDDGKLNYEAWAEYDSEGRILHTRTTSWNNYEMWYEYDEFGNKTYEGDSNGQWWKTKYDSDGNIVFSSDDMGYETVYEYEEIAGSKKLVHKTERNTKRNSEEEIYFEYDSLGNLTVERTGQLKINIYEYDARGNLIHHKKEFGPEEWYEYDESNRVTYKKTTPGAQLENHTLENGHSSYDYLTHYNEEWLEYDGEGRITYWKKNTYTGLEPIQYENGRWGDKELFLTSECWIEYNFGYKINFYKSSGGFYDSKVEVSFIDSYGHTTCTVDDFSIKRTDYSYFPDGSVKSITTYSIYKK